MTELSLFDGDMEAFIARNPGEYEVIKLPEGQELLKGGLLKLELTDKEKKPFLRKNDIFNPMSWGKVNYLSRQETYSELKAFAVKNWADAIIKYKKAGEGSNIIETGILVRRINGSSSK
jgi:hypothetical protein